MKTAHVPVMVEEVLGFFADRPLKIFFDGTLGAGGHASAILEAHPEIELYIGCDRDPVALSIAAANLEKWKDKVKFVHSNHSEVEAVLASLGVDKVDGFFLT